jgi:FG-GAP-like repeat/Fibronectin type III domain
MRRKIVGTTLRILATSLFGALAMAVPAGAGPSNHAISGSANRPTSSGCGQNWTVMHGITIAGDSGNYALNGVSAISDKDVWSVGYQVARTVDVQPLIVQWNGTQTVQVASPEVSSVGAELDSVSLDSADDGWAVGFAQPGTDSYNTLAEQWNGTTWTPVTTPNEAQGLSATNILISTQSLSPSDAWAVGYSDESNQSQAQPLAEMWNGTSWAVQPAVSVGTVGTALLGVNGDNPDDVWAVGYSSTSTYQDDPVIEHWDGTAWTVIPGDPNVGNAVLTSVSASGPDDAWAVGYTDDFQPVTEHWNGSSWTEVTVPSLGSVELIRSVVDFSATSAWAVGTAYVGGQTNAYEGVYLFWNGTQWAVQGLAAPSNGTTQARGISAVPNSSSLWVAGGQSYSLQSVCNSNGLEAAVEATRSSPDQAVPGSRRSSDDRATIKSGAKAAVRRAGARQLTVQPSNVVAVDEAASSGLAQSTVGWAATIGDFTGDGLPDVFLMRGTEQASLYLNNGNGTFSQIDQGQFPAADRWDCVSADVNQDGNLDVFCAIGADHGNGLKANELYMEQPNTNFIDEANQYGLLDPTGRARAATFINVTPGGPPDLFVGNLPFRADGLPHPNRLYLNTGNGFVDDPQAGLDLPIGASCATAGDYMNSGVQDLLICTPEGTEHLYQNNDGTFTDVTSQSGLPSVPARDAAFVDLNGDGLLDIVLVTGSQLLVYLQRPNHTFAKSFATPLIGGTSLGIGDVNGDGSPDILVTQESSNGVKAPDLMLLNNGSGTNFTEMSIPQVAVGSGDAVYPIDFEGNGLTDFLVLNGKGEHVPEPLQLLSFFPNVVPGAPTIESVTATSESGAAEVDFTPGTDDGSPVTSYTVTATDVTNPANGSETTSGTGSPVTIDGLASGDTYSVTVTATNATGTSTASDPFLLYPNVAPGAPTIESATAAPGSGVAQVDFTPGADDGSPVTSYTVTATDLTNPANGGETASAAGSPITIVGLTSGDTYSFTVTATNATGTSPASDPSETVTP